MDAVRALHSYTERRRELFLAAAVENPDSYKQMQASAY